MDSMDLELGPGCVELDTESMAQVTGGGPFGEFVYDMTHAIVRGIRFVYDVRPVYGPGQAGYASAKAG